MRRAQHPGSVAILVLFAAGVFDVARPAHGQESRTSGQPAQAPAYVARGRGVEARQRQLAERLSKFHDTLVVELRQTAPELLPRLEPPPAIALGYQLLPRIVPGPAAQPVAAPSPLVSYSWRWSETLMDGETSELAQLELSLRRAPAGPARRSTLDSLVTGYRELIERKKGVDADVNYNWMWQAEVTRIRAAYDRATAMSDAILRMRGTQTPKQRAADSTLVAGGLAADMQLVSPPTFLKYEHTGSRWTIIVPMVTDIEDTGFVNEFARVVAERWQARSAAGVEYRVIPVIRLISPAALYCGIKDSARAAAPCAPPSRGAAIDFASHVARFPAGVGILTTGAGSTHFEGGRVIALSPHEAPRHLIVHEFGHLLGFRDAYIRGYHEAGADGLIITELVVDNTDVMGNSKDGSIRASHFERLLSAKDVPAIMQAGLSAMYERNDARAAALKFEEVLARQPFHYGARFQLAKALDAMGQPSEAAAQWTRVLEAAQFIGDSATIRQVKERLAPRP